jgi:hypothetical protein
VDADQRTNHPTRTSRGRRMTLNGCGKSSMTTAASAEISGFVDNACQFLKRKLIWSSLAEQAEKELLTVLALKEPTYAEIDALIAKFDIHTFRSRLLRDSGTARRPRISY